MIQQYVPADIASKDNVQEYIVDMLFSLAALAADAKQLALARLIIDAADSSAMLSI